MCRVRTSYPQELPLTRDLSLRARRLHLSRTTSVILDRLSLRRGVPASRVVDELLLAAEQKETQI